MANAIEGAAGPPFVFYSIFLPNVLDPRRSYLLCSAVITRVANGAIVTASPFWRRISLRLGWATRSASYSSERTGDDRPGKKETAGSLRPSQVSPSGVHRNSI